jgi:hypothetical protein
MALLRIGYFILDRIAEPVSQSIEVVARQSPAFRSKCVSLARYYENSEIARNSRFLKPSEVTTERLSEEQAVHRGAEILGEGVLWTIGLSVLLHQYYKDQVDEKDELAAKEARRIDKEELFRLTVISSERKIIERIDALEARIDAQSEIVRQNELTTNIKAQLRTERIPRYEWLSSWLGYY